MSPGPDARQSPDRAGFVLAALILVSAVANLNLAVANVALPAIGKELDASQTGLNLIAIGYSLGLAASVLYLGAVGDRYGRKLLLMVGTAIAIPAAILAAVSGSVELLFAARLIGGLAAGMAFPTTLALITALWAGPARTRSIALWSSIGGALSALGPIAAGALLEHFEWGSVFIITVPLAALALLLAWRFVPAHVNETTEPVDHLSGVLSIVLVALVVFSLNFAAMPGKGALALGLLLVGMAFAGAFVLRQRRLEVPLYDLAVASRRIFWVAAVAGIIVFGSLMAAMFIGQQYLQNVLGYSSLEAGAAILPAALAMVVVAPRSARLVVSHGSRLTLVLGYLACLAAFLWMLAFWDEDASYFSVAVAYVLMGVGVGLAGTPASNALTGAVPVRRAGMASSTADLQRDLGGALMQSLLGALLTAGYFKAATAAIGASEQASAVSDSVKAQLTKSFAGAESIAARYPQYSDQIVAAARQSFIDGQDMAYVAGVLAVLLGSLLVWTLFPGHDEERETLAGYAAEDGGAPDD